MGRQRMYVNELGDCVVNETGFSWFAALVSPVWALQRRLYLVALALFVTGVATSYYADTDRMRRFSDRSPSKLTLDGNKSAGSTVLQLGADSVESGQLLKGGLRERWVGSSMAA